MQNEAKSVSISKLPYYKSKQLEVKKFSPEKRHLVTILSPLVFVSFLQ